MCTRKQRNKQPHTHTQLGCGDSSSFPKDRHAPVLVRTEDGEPLQDIVQISAGKYHSAAVDKHGRVYTWGYGGRKVRFVTPGHLLGYAAPKGALLNYSPFARPIPDFGPENGMEVEGDEPKPFVEGQTINPKATKVVCGSIHTAVLDSAGRAWTWGYGEWGRLGHDDNEDRVRPTPVVAFLDEKTGLVCSLSLFPFPFPSPLGTHEKVNHDATTATFLHTAPHASL